MFHPIFRGQQHGVNGGPYRAAQPHTSGFNIHKVGDILLVVGIILAIVSVILLVLSSRRRVTTRTDVHATPTGRERVQEREDWGGGNY